MVVYNHIVPSYFLQQANDADAFAYSSAVHLINRIGADRLKDLRLPHPKTEPDAFRRVMEWLEECYDRTQVSRLSEYLDLRPTPVQIEHLEIIRESVRDFSWFRDAKPFGDMNPYEWQFFLESYVPLSAPNEAEARACDRIRSMSGKNFTLIEGKETRVSVWWYSAAFRRHEEYSRRVFDHLYEERCADNEPFYQQNVDKLLTGAPPDIGVDKGMAYDFFRDWSPTIARVGLPRNKIISKKLTKQEQRAAMDRRLGLR